jgi:4-amino-4-deoxy-L-arabinose transferase-like glycosyltransferase
LAGGSVVRVLLALSVTSYGALVGDARAYSRLAQNMLEHGVFSLSETAPYLPTAIRPPLYPAFLAAVRWLCGAQVWPVLVLQAVMGLVTALLLASVVSRRWSVRTGRVALVLLMVSPLDAIYFGTLLSETLTALMLALVLWLPRRESSWSRWAVAGLALGGLLLARDVYSPLLLLLPATFVLRHERPKRPVLAAVCMGGFCVLAVAPWSLRNTTIGAPALVSRGNFGFNLWVGTWERNAGWVTEPLSFPPDAFRSPEERALLEPLAPDMSQYLFRDATFREAAVSRLRDAPAKTISTWLKRSYAPWVGTRTDLVDLRPARGSLLWLVAKSSAFALNALSLGLGLVGFILLLRRRQPVWWLATPVLFSALVYLPFHNTETRYTQPVFPLVLCFAAYAVVRLRRAIPRLARKNARAAEPKAR